jgi:hypothetical protein
MGRSSYVTNQRARSHLRWEILPDEWVLGWHPPQRVGFPLIGGGISPAGEWWG